MPASAFVPAGQGVTLFSAGVVSAVIFAGVKAATLLFEHPLP